MPVGMVAIALASLVLGIIPIIQGAAAKQAINISNATSKKFLLAFDIWIGQLEMHRDRLVISLSKLLSPVIEREDVDKMLRSTKSPLWKDAQVRSRLVKAYRTDYDAFEKRLDHVFVIMKGVGLKLGLGNTEMTEEQFDDLVVRAVADPSSITYSARQRYWVASDIATIKQLFKQLDLAQMRLETLVQNCLTMTERRPDPSVGDIISLRLFRQRMTALYTVLSSLSRCREHMLHRTNLHLAYRGPSTNETPGNQSEGTLNRFKIVLAEPWGWQRGECFVQDATSVATEEPSPSADFDVAEDDQICPILQQAQRPCLGLHIDMRSDPKLTAVYSVSGPDDSSAAGAVELCTLLSQDNPGNFAFPYEDRLRLSVVLISAIRQLHTTDWLLEDWSTKDILLVRKNHDVWYRKYDVENPFLSHLFGAPLDSAKNNRRTRELPASMRAALLKLGITLIELWFCREIDAVPAAALDDEGPPHLRSNWNSLQEWMRESSCSLPKAVREAVARCGSLDGQSDEEIASALLKMDRDVNFASQLFTGSVEAGT